MASNLRSNSLKWSIYIIPSHFTLVPFGDPLLAETIKHFFHTFLHFDMNELLSYLSRPIIFAKMFSRMRYYALIFIFRIIFCMGPAIALLFSHYDLQDLFRNLFLTTNFVEPIVL